MSSVPPIDSPSTITNRGTGYRYAQSILVLLIVAGVMLFGLEKYNQYEVRQSLLTDIQVEHKHSQQRLNRYLLSKYDSLNFIQATPPIDALMRTQLNGGIDPHSGSTLQQWQQRLQQILSAYMANHSDIRNIQYQDSQGQTLATASRRERLSVGISAATPPGKEAFGDLSAGQFYVSGIQLARQQQQIEYPLWPAITFAVPIFTPQQQLFGYLSITFDATSLLDNLRDAIAAPFELIVTNQHGQFLLHPKQSLEFSHELGLTTSWASIYGNDPDEYSNQVEYFRVNNSGLYVLSDQISLGSPELNHKLVLYTTLPDSRLAQEVRQRRGDSLIVFALLVGLLLMLLAGYQQYVSTRLRWLAERAQFEAIVDNSSDAILTLDLAGHIQSCNRSTEVLFGQHQATLIGQPAHGTLLDSNDQELSAEMLNSAIRERRSLKAHCEGCFGERRFPIEVSLMPIVTDEGLYSGCSLTLRDRSEQALLTEQVRNEYQQRLDEQQQQQQRQQQLLLQTQRLVKSKDRLLAAISHEIRTPMNSIQGVLNLLSKEATDPGQQRYLGMAYSSVQNVSRLMNDVLDYSNLRSGKLFFEDVEFSLTATLSPVLKHYAEAAYSKGLSLIIDSTELAHDRVRSDPNRLRQVVDNLVSNAVKFTRFGYILVELRSEEDVDYGIRFQMRVKDTGIGLDSHQQQHLFTTFENMDDETSERLGGAGLGVALSQQLCLLMGGELRVSSNEQQGSCFEFHIIASPVAGNSQHPLYHDGGYQNSCWFLRLDDELLLETLARQIRQRGGQVVIAGSEQEEQSYSVILTETRYLGDYAEALQNEGRPHVMAITPPSSQALPQGNSLELTELALPVTQESLALAFAQAEGDHRSHAILAASSALNQERMFQRQRVLVVDDDEVNLEVISRQLEEMGLRCDGANHGGAAIERLLHSELFDPYLLVLMDCQMPLVDGYSATRRIRQGEAGQRYEQIPVIAITAAAQQEDRQRCIRAGMNDYLVKPMAIDQLHAMLSQWLDSQRALPRSDSPIVTAITPTTESKRHDNGTSQDWNKSTALQHCQQDRALLARVVSTFAEKASRQISNISLSEENLAAIASTLEPLVQDSTHIGAETLQQRLQQLQQVLELQEAQDAAHLLQQLQQDLQHFLMLVRADVDMEISE